MADATLDTSGLRCPLPVLRARRAMKSLPVGATLEITATDPTAKTDFPAFCELTGYVLEEASEAHGIFRFVIRKTSAR